MSDTPLSDLYRIDELFSRSEKLNREHVMGRWAIKHIALIRAGLILLDEPEIEVTPEGRAIAAAYKKRQEESK